MANRPLIAGNWKMHGLQSSEVELSRIITGAGELSGLDLLICPPATLIAAFAAATRGSSVAVGGQDCHAQNFGAFTGDISAEMLQDAGASAVIVGHSERRMYHKETDVDVRAKALAARRAGLLAVVCIGETQAERQAGRTIDVIRAQLEGSLPDTAAGENTVIAYEPVWAIGTGLTPTPGDVAEVHRFIRGCLTARYGVSGQGIRLLYGGSVKPSNAGELLRVDDVDGALIGGASLKADDFLAIARARLP
jgi:triosephosphate isomerase